MIEFLINYWLEALLGAILFLLGLFGKKIWAIFQKGLKTEHKEGYEEDAKPINDAIAKFETRFVESQQKLQELATGVLKLYEISFKAYCRTLLAEEHELTLEEFENCQKEYEIYSALGGNGTGSSLFRLVSEKAHRTLTD